ncbi:redoxin domain-containing protein [Sphingobacterium olei]|uniref:Redoxin domain-containing protein n=1 Tax=Sphingobacterium olei TaxID=2571155 RepID=A0A4U0NIE3_9SPHI|nr:thioredoxin-like domain-containing protein [Sphingobacterium olei]TJZ53783.1 redoxin domain-containing protein [Sphingobacterium olei]
MNIFFKDGRGLCYFKPLSHLFKSKNSQSGTLFSFVLSLICVLFSDAQAQSAGERAVIGAEDIKPLVIGQKVPDEFWTREHLFFVNGDTIRKSLEEHKGKMLVLDFWSSGCAPCLLHQKEIREFVEKYKDQLVVIMVNSKNTRENFEKIKGLYDKRFFEKFEIKQLETIIHDQYLMTIFSSAVFPHYVWINTIDRLQLKTYRNLLDKNYVAPFIDLP